MSFLNTSLACSSNPVEQAYNGGETVNVRKLRDYFDSANANFSSINSALSRADLEVARLEAELSGVRHVNKQLIQFMNWLAVTNPQILDEFQTTADAFEKLSPRDEQGYAAASSGP